MGKYSTDLGSFTKALTTKGGFDLAHLIELHPVLMGRFAYCCPVAQKERSPSGHGLPKAPTSWTRSDQRQNICHDPMSHPYTLLKLFIIK